MKRKTSDLKQNPNYRKEPEPKPTSYVGDPKLLHRVKQYLDSKKDKPVVSITSIAGDLQSKYGEYSRKKKNAFRKSVAKVYSIIQESKHKEGDQYSKEERAYLDKRRKIGTSDSSSDSSSDSDSSGSYSSDPTKYVEYKDTNSMNASIKSLYQSGASSRNSSRAPSNCPSPAHPFAAEEEDDDLFIVDRKGDKEKRSQKPKELSKQLVQHFLKKLDKAKKPGHCLKCHDGNLCAQCQAKCATSSTETITEIDITDDPQSSTHAQSIGHPGEIMTDPVHSMDVEADGQNDQHMTEETTGARGKKDSNMVTILSSGEDEEPEVSCDPHLSQSPFLSLPVPESTRSAMDLSSGLVSVGLPQSLISGFPNASMQSSLPGLVQLASASSMAAAAMSSGLPPIQPVTDQCIPSPCLMPPYQYEVAPQLTATSLPSHINYVNNPNPDRKGGPEIQVVDDPLPPQSTVANLKEQVSSRKMSSRHRKKRSDQDKDEKKDSESTKKGPRVLKSTVKFADVGGNDATLTEVCRMLVHLRHPEIYKQLGVTPPRGFLLHGPPGCGKTLLAHAIAGELDLPFIKLAATEVVSGVSGESEEKIRSLFEQAIAAAPCIMFIDEIDAISPKRETASKDMERRIVSQLLTCMDDLSSRTSEHVLVIGATNRPDSIDPALRRAGRFDREICLGIPDENARERILQVLCRDLRLISDFDYCQLAHKTPGYVGADLTALVREAAMSAVNRVFKALQETSSNPHPSVLPAPATSNQTHLQHPFVNSDSTIQSYDLPALNSDPTAVDDPRHQCATASLNETLVAAESAGDVSDMVNSSECGVLQMDISSCSSMKDLSTIGDKVLSGEFVTQPEMCEPTKGDSILPIAAEITESSSRKEEHLPSEKLHKERHEFESILLWLKEHPPLTDEQLSDLFITHDDFISALQHVQPSAKREGFATVPDVTWDDIGALQEVREELQMAILAPVKHRAQFKAVGLTSPPGILLAGPPGCGKTLLAKAIANESGINFISVKGPELLNMYVGESERAVRQVFQRARNSSPCVIFFDELDALCPRRSGSSEGGSSVRVVNQLLTEMDGLEERKQVFIMAATNRPDIIDPAVLRPGRLDKTLYVGLPDCKDRLDILTTITKMGTKPQLASDVSLAAVAEDERCTRYTGADLSALVREAAVSALREYLTSSRPLSDAISVTHNHFDIAFQKVKPSVSLKDMEVYSKMKMKNNLSS